MRTLIFILTFLAGQSLFSQDTTTTWMFSIDTSAFTVRYDKGFIPAELYSAIGIQSTRDIANPHMPYHKGCTGTGTMPHKRLNWIAQDSSNHWILCISYGGKASGTQFYFIDKHTGEINSNVFYLHGINPEDYSLSTVLTKLKSGQYKRESAK